MKLHFETEIERDAYNAAEAEFRNCDMHDTIYWYGWGEMRMVITF